MGSVFHTTFGAMATRLDLVIPGISQRSGNQIAMEVNRELNRLENLLNPYHVDSIIAKANQYAHHHEVEIGSELCFVLKRCISFWHDTKGYFDISMLGIKQKARNKNKLIEVCLDDPEEKGESGMKYIVLDDRKNTIRFLSSDVQIDTGGFGKGYALDRIQMILHHANIDSAFVSFGESSLLGLGCHPSGNPWQIRLEYPEQINEECILTLSDTFVSVSGFTRKNKGTHASHLVHLIDPLTHAPINSVGFVAVCTRSGLESEALSTALYLAKPEEYSSILSVFNYEYVCRLISDKNGKITKSEIYKSK